MKKVTLFLLALTATFVLTGCIKELLGEALVGSSISFSAATSYNNNPGTKTEYSGVIVGDEVLGETPAKERINWLATDKIRIYSDVATDRNTGAHFSDYAVTPAGNSGAISSANIAPLPNAQGLANGLEWGSGAHKFFALYPSPKTDGVNESKVDVGNGTFKGTIPAVQTLSITGNVGKPDMRYAYMWAAAKVSNPSASAVELAFQPAITAFEFSIGGLDGKALTVTAAELISTSKALSGDFTGTFSSDLSSVTYSCPAYASGTNNSVRVNFSSPVVIEENGSFKFTLFALPQDLTNLSLRLITNGEDYTDVSLKLALTMQNGTPISFEGGKKYFITNIGVPTGRIYRVEDIGPVTKTYTGGDQTVAVKSYSTIGGTNKQPAKWHLEFSTNSGATWTKMTATVRPSWLTSNKYTGNGSITSENVKLTVTAAEMAHVDKDASNNFPRTNFVSTNKNAPYDLSTHDIYYAAWSDNHIETANCYIIQRPGWYMFPLVYGNAINTRKSNNTTTGNKNAYAPTSAAYSDTYLTPFKKHDDSGITSPYIATTNATVVRVAWQDAYSSIIREVDNNTGEVLLDLVDGSAVGGRLNCKYVRFYIDPVKENAGQPDELDHMQRANAVIKVMTGNNTLWSWHIWMTDQTLSEINVKYWTSNGGTASLNHLNMNLGWINGTKKVADYYPHEGCLVRVVADDAPSYAFATFSVSRTAYNKGNWTDQVVNIAPLWQWGRKDPMLPIFSGDGVEVGTDKYYAPGTDSWHIVKRSSATTLGYSIQHPFTFVTGSGNATTYGVAKDWMWERDNKAHYFNLWDATQTRSGETSENTLPTARRGGAADKATVKTVYDPCPPGFCIPRRNAYSGFLDSSTMSTADPRPGYGGHVYIAQQWNRGLTFYTQMKNSGATIRFPADGARAWDTGLLMYNSSFYWTSAPLDAYHAGYMNLNNQYVGPFYGIYNLAHRSRGHSVRPAREE